MDKKTRIYIINGPNLNLLGKREPHIYGNLSFDEYFSGLQKMFKNQAELFYYQSNHEGFTIDQLHQAMDEQVDGIVLNAGAYTHTSVAIRDAIAAIKIPVIEVHISNVHAREAFRHTSLIAPVCCGSIVGLGLKGYEMAVRFFLKTNT